MKKIMFNDEYGLTKAVLEGRKTMMRRVILKGFVGVSYKIGEVVKVAQAYKDLPNVFAECGIAWPTARGWGNKMFVKAALMPHRIRITDIKVERLQDITEEDARKEGLEMVYYGNEEWYKVCSTNGGIIAAPTAREAFSALIDKISGSGTWESNPVVYVYEFELVNGD